MNRFFLLIFIWCIFVFCSCSVEAQQPQRSGDQNQPLWQNCVIDNISVDAGTSKCVGHRKYSCEDPGGTIDDCASRGEECWLSNIDKTRAKCYPKAETATACVHDGIFYQSGESWCLVGTIFSCNNARAVLGKDCMTLDIKTGKVGGHCAVKSITPIKTAHCVMPGTPGCMHTDGVFYNVGDFVCSSGRDKVLRCDGTDQLGLSKFTEFSTCLNKSCVRNGLRDVSCSIAGGSSPLDGRAIENLRKSMSYGGINEACNPLTAVYIPQIPNIPQPSLPGVGQIVGFANEVINTAAGPFVKFMNDQLLSFMGQRCYEGEPEITGNPAQCMCRNPKTRAIVALCRYINDSNEKKACEDCAEKGIWTAIGCIDYRFDSFIQNIVFGRGVALAGFITFFCIIYAAFILQTSSGDPQKIKKAQELMTSCIMGLMLIIFSVFILRVIGVNVLRIPGFGI